MSALAHKSIDHTNIASVQLDSEPAVTSISVSARIDYIQRFSKQAVLVIDNDVSVYTQAARQFLINLSKETPQQEANVAFVSASTKLNDIQMRCRLIEQLFANTLFDPEKSLAVSILQLSKKNKDSLTIVVEHAHALSLQMKYELCQLVDVANKTHSKINVVLFGQDQAAEQAAANKSIFKNKLAIIDAKSGQLFPLEHAKFNHENVVFTPKFWQKLMITIISISLLIGLSWYVLNDYDTLTLSQLPESNAQKIEQASIEANSILIKENTKDPLLTDVLTGAKPNTLADTADIHAALLGTETFTAKSENTPAKPNDILQALDFTKSQITSTQAITTEVVKEITPKLAFNQEVKKLNNADSVLMLTPNYYLDLSIGYVVQIVGFTDMTLLDRFTKQYPSLEYFSYQKKLNGQLFVVLTTKVFDSKEQARTAIQALPQTIIERGVWIKALSTVQDEINKS